ncbi:MAG: tape measure protein [Pseudomonadota bacterium]|nr:tape measure protein [Pseudomonadota bacterium]
MATDLTAKLTLEAEASGQDSLRQVADEVRKLGEGANASAPQFKVLADELDQLAEQQALIDGFREAKRATADLQQQMAGAADDVERLAAEQARAAEAAEAAADARLDAARDVQQQYKDVLGAARAELKELGEASKQAGGDTALLRERMGDARAQITALEAGYRDAGAQVKALGGEHKRSADATREAATAQKTVTGEYERSVAAAGRVSARLGEQNRALDDNRQAMQAAGLSSTQLQQAQERVNQRMDAANDKLRSVAVLYGGVGEAAAESAQQSGQAARESGAAWGDMANKLTVVQGAVASLFAVAKLKAMAGSAIATADAFGQMAERIRMATRDEEEFDLVQSRLLATANTTYRALGEQQEMYIRSAEALRALGYSTGEVLDITDSYSYLLATNAASADKAASAVDAYTKSIQSGRLDSQGWQSMLAATPTLVDAIATATGKTTEQVRQLGITGKLSVRDLNEGLRQTVDANRDAVEGMSTTLADALTRLSNTWGEWLRNANESSGATRMLVGLTDLLSQNLDSLVGVAGAVGATMVSVFGLRALAAVRGYAAALLSTVQAQDAVAGSATRAGTAVSAMGLAMQRAGGLMRGAGYGAIIAQLAQIGAGFMEIHRQQQLQAKLAASVEKQDARIAERLREIATATGVAVDSMEALNAAQAAGTLVFDEAQGKWLSAAQAQQQLAGAVGQTAEQLASLQATQAVDAFRAITDEGGKAEDAVKKLAESLRFDDAAGAAGFVRALEALRATGVATAEQVGQAWQLALDRLGGTQLGELRAGLAEAAREGVLSAQQLADANDRILSAAFARVGVNAAQALGRVSEGAQDAADAIDVVAAGVQAAGADAETAARAIEMAFAAAVPKADSLQAIELLAQRLHGMADAGRVGAEGVERIRAALERQRQAIEGQLPGIQRLEEALRQLGVTPQRELAQAARVAREAFDAVRASGAATARELAQSWQAMAEAQIAASGGVADAALKAQAAQNGFVVEADKTGKAVVKSMAEAEAATKRYTDALQKQAQVAVARQRHAQADIDLQSAGVRLALEQQRAIHEVAKARGDEAAAMRAQQQMRSLEIELAQLAAEAKRAEADAALTMAELRRQELIALGEYSGAKKEEADAALKAAEAKAKEAEIAEVMAQRMRDLANTEKEVAKAAGDTKEAHEEAAKAIEFTWLSATAQASKYRDEAARHAEEMAGSLQKYFSAGMSWGMYINAWNNYYGELRRLADAYAKSLEDIDARQRALEQRNSGAGKGVEDLRLRLLELNGTEEEIARARAARDRAEIERQVQLAQLEAERATLRGDGAAVEQFQREIALLQEQLGLLEQITAAEGKRRREQVRECEREPERGGRGEGGGRGGSEGGGAGRAGGGAGPVTINLTANGVNDPARLARLIEPEMRKLARLAR